MQAELSPGERVRLRAYRDAIIERIVVRVDGDIVYVSRESELSSARAEDREPNSVGFRKAAIIPEEAIEHATPR
jgi:hypothetical protein